MILSDKSERFGIDVFASNIKRVSIVLQTVYAIGYRIEPGCYHITLHKIRGKLILSVGKSLEGIGRAVIMPTGAGRYLLKSVLIEKLVGVDCYLIGVSLREIVEHIVGPIGLKYGFGHFVYELIGVIPAII